MDRIYGVRIPVPSIDRRTLMECLACTGTVVVHRVEGLGICYDLMPPSGVHETLEWAEHCAAYMRTIGFNALVVPLWENNHGS